MRLFDFLSNVPFVKVKQSVIISNKHGIYELPHELPTDLGNYEISEKSKSFIKLKPSVQPYSQNESFVNTAKKTDEK